MAQVAPWGQGGQGGFPSQHVGMAYFRFGMAYFRCAKRKIHPGRFFPNKNRRLENMIPDGSVCFKTFSTSGKTFSTRLFQDVAMA